MALYHQLKFPSTFIEWKGVVVIRNFDSLETAPYEWQSSDPTCSPVPRQASPRGLYSVSAITHKLITYLTNPITCFINKQN